MKSDKSQQRQMDICWLMDDKVGLDNQTTGRTKMQLGFGHYLCQGFCHLSVPLSSLLSPLNGCPLLLAFMPWSHFFCHQITERVWL